MHKHKCYKYLICVKFEMTLEEEVCEDLPYAGNLRLRTEEISPAEIIEFSVVLVEVISGIILKTFREFIYPTERPILSQQCKDVTKIRQHQVDKGIILEKCLNKLNDWMEKVTNKHNLTWDTYLHGEKVNTAFVAWNNTDIENLCMECSRKRIRMPSYFDKWIDLVFIWKKKYYKYVTFREAIERDGVRFDRIARSALDDCRNLAYLGVYLANNRYKLKYTSRIN